MEKSKIIVHHYLKTKEGEYTTTKVAEEDYLEGKQGETYTTTPKLDLEEYSLEKDTEGNYVIPQNATGIFKPGTQEVIYYYEEKQVPISPFVTISCATPPFFNGTFSFVPSI